MCSVVSRRWLYCSTTQLFGLSLAFTQQWSNYRSFRAYNSTIYNKNIKKSSASSCIVLCLLNPSVSTRTTHSMFVEPFSFYPQYTLYNRKCSMFKLMILFIITVLIKDTIWFYNSVGLETANCRIMLATESQTLQFLPVLG
jgi:hypothetical protein